MISHFDRRHAVELIDEAVTAGARQHKACAILELSARTYQRWTQDVAVLRTLIDIKFPTSSWT